MLYRKIIYILGILLLLIVNILPVSAQEEVRVTTNGTITETQQNDNTLFVGGSFTEVQVNENTSVQRTNLSEVDLDSEEVTSWNPKPNEAVQDIKIYEDNLFIAGQFTEISSQELSYFALINTESKDLLDADLDFNDPVYALAIDEQVLYVGGSFTQVNNLERKYLLSYNLQSKAITTWNPDINGNIYEITVHNGIMYMGGSFTSVNGEERNHLAAFSIESGELTNWNPSVDTVVTKIHFLPETIVITGYLRNEDEVEGRRITISQENNEIILDEPIETEISPFPTSALPQELTPEPTEATVAGLMVDKQALGFEIPTLSDILTFAIRAFFVIAGLAALFFLLLGAFGWVTSGGDQESVDAARNKIQAAIVGLLMMVAVLSIVWTLEQVIFNRRLCFGVSCPVTIPSLLQPIEEESTDP